MVCTEENNNIIMCSSTIVARLIYADVLPEKVFSPHTVSSHHYLCCEAYVSLMK